MGINIATEGKVVRLTIDRPPVNVLDEAMIKALDEAIAGPAASAGVVVLAAAGTRAFSAGVDVASHEPSHAPAMLRAFHACLRRLVSVDAVTVAAVHGRCFGGAFEIVSLCDLVVAEEGTEFAVPEIRLACFPPAAVALWPARIGPARAADLVLTGRSIGPEEAWEMGLVSRVAKQGSLDGSVGGLVKELGLTSLAARRVALRALRKQWVPAFLAALDEAERTYIEDLTVLPDCAEGIRAFLDKRPPVWRD